MQRQAADVDTVDMEAVEGHEHGRCAWLVRLAGPEQMEPAHEVLVEDSDFAIEDQRRRFQRCDSGGELAEVLGVVDLLAADESDARAILEGEHAPAVVIFFLDAAGTMEPAWRGPAASAQVLAPDPRP